MPTECERNSSSLAAQKQQQHQQQQQQQLEQQHQDLASYQQTFGMNNEISEQLIETITTTNMAMRNQSSDMLSKSQKSVDSPTTPTTDNVTTNGLKGSTNGGESKKTSLISPDPTSYVTKARVTRPIPPPPSYNPMQFVQIKPCNLYQTAQEQLKKAEEVKKIKEIKKEEPEEWQNNLDNWKSSRRKRVEHIIDRVVEVKKLELEEHDRTRRKSKTFSEMIEERGERAGGRPRTKLTSLTVYNEDETNDLSDLGIGTSSASGKSSLSDDYDNNSVTSDNAELDKAIQNENNHKSNVQQVREYISSPGYETSSSTAPASSPDPCEYTYEGAIQDYKQRISRAAASITTTVAGGSYKLGNNSNNNNNNNNNNNSNNMIGNGEQQQQHEQQEQSRSSNFNTPKPAPPTTLNLNSIGKSTSSETKQTNSEQQYSSRRGHKIEDRLLSFEITSPSAQENQDGLEKNKVDLPKIDISKRKEIFENQNASSNGTTNTTNTTGGTTNGNVTENNVPPPRVTLRDRFKTEKSIEEESNQKKEIKRLSGDVTSIRQRMMSLEQKEPTANITTRSSVDIPVPPLKDRLSSLQNAVKKEEIKKPPVALVDARQLEIMKKEEEEAKQRMQEQDVVKGNSELNDSGILTAEETTESASLEQQQQRQQQDQQIQEQESQLNAAIAALALEEQQLEQAANAVNQIEAEFDELSNAATAQVASNSTNQTQLPYEMDFSINEALELALEAIDKENKLTANDAVVKFEETKIQIKIETTNQINKNQNEKENENYNQKNKVKDVVIDENEDEGGKETTIVKGKNQKIQEIARYVTPQQQEEDQQQQPEIKLEPIYENIGMQTSLTITTQTTSSLSSTTTTSSTLLTNKKSNETNSIIIPNNNMNSNHEQRKSCIDNNNDNNKQQQQQQQKQKQDNTTYHHNHQIYKNNMINNNANRNNCENIENNNNNNNNNHTPMKKLPKVEPTTPTTQSDHEPYYQVPKSSEPYYDAPKHLRPVPVYENIEVFYNGFENSSLSSPSLPVVGALNGFPLEPPKEKPPPPPSESPPPIHDEDTTDAWSSSENTYETISSSRHHPLKNNNNNNNNNEHPSPPIKRVNSTKRIKKELRNKRSSFLGIDPSALDDEEQYLEMTVAPPPDMSQFLQQERQLEKQLYMKATGLCDSSDTGESRDSGVSENHSRQSSEHYTNSSEENERHIDVDVGVSVDEPLYRNENPNAHTTPLLQTVKGDSAESWTESATAAAAASQSLTEATATANAKINSIEEKIREQEEVLRVERELLQLEQEELKRQRENLMLRENMARRELQHGAKMLMSANRRSLQELNGNAVPTMPTPLAALSQLPPPSNQQLQQQQQIYANIPNLQQQYYQMDIDYRKSMSDLNEFSAAAAKRNSLPPVPPTKPMRAMHLTTTTSETVTTTTTNVPNGHHAPHPHHQEYVVMTAAANQRFGGSLVKIAAPAPTAAPRSHIYSNYQHRSQQNLSTSSNTSNLVQLTPPPPHHGNMTRNTLHALSATPKPKYTDGWVQQQQQQFQNRKSVDALNQFANDPAWLSAFHQKRKSMPDSGSSTYSAYNNNHWLVQEAEQRRLTEEQRRSLSTGNTPLHQQKGNGSGVGVGIGKPLPDAIIQTLTERVQSKGIGERKRLDNYKSTDRSPLHAASAYQHNHHYQQQQQLRDSYTQSTTQTTQSSAATSTTSSTSTAQDKVLSVSGKKKCSHCGDELGRGAAMIIESLLLFYHINCFKCCVCHVQLGDGLNGTDVRVRNHKLHCQNCYSSDDGVKFSCV